MLLVTLESSRNIQVFFIGVSSVVELFIPHCLENELYILVPSHTVTGDKYVTATLSHLHCIFHIVLRS